MRVCLTNIRRTLIVCRLLGVYEKSWRRNVHNSKYSTSQKHNFYHLTIFFIYISKNIKYLSIAIYFLHSYSLYFYANSYRYERNEKIGT